MRIAGLPVWALVLAACVLVPFAVQMWIDAERRRAKERTRLLLQTLDAARAGPIAGASAARRLQGPPTRGRGAHSNGPGPANAASQGEDDMHHPQDPSLPPRARGAPDS